MIRTYLIPLVIVLLAAAVVLAVPGTNSFRLDPEEMPGRIGDQGFIIDGTGLENFRKEGRSLVSLDDSQEFRLHPVNGAVNFPPGNWNAKSIRKFFRDKEGAVLYAGDLTLACKAWILFTQMGIRDLRVSDLRAGSEGDLDKPSFVFIPAGGSADPADPD